MVAGAHDSAVGWHPHTEPDPGALQVLRLSPPVSLRPRCSLALTERRAE